MKEISSFTIKKLSSAGSELIYEQKKCACSISGVSLDKQFKLDNNYFLIFTTDDSPYEETLYITLLDDQFQFLDCVDLGMAYQPGILEKVEVTSNYSLEFEFYTDITHRINIDPVGTRFNFTKPLLDVSYHWPVFRKRYIKIDRIDK